LPGLPGSGTGDLEVELLAQIAELAPQLVELGREVVDAGLEVLIACCTGGRQGRQDRHSLHHGTTRYHAALPGRSGAPSRPAQRREDRAPHGSAPREDRGLVGNRSGLAGEIAEDLEVGAAVEQGSHHPERDLIERDPDRVGLTGLDRRRRDELGDQDGTTPLVWMMSPASRRPAAPA